MPARLADRTAHVDVTLDRNRQEVVRVGPEDCAQRVVETPTRCAQAGASVDHAADPQLGPSQDEVADHGDRGGGLGALAAQEAQPGRRGREEVADLDGGARRCAAAPLLHRLAVADPQARAHRGGGGARRHGHVGDRRDARERLTAEAEGGHRLEVIDGADLRRRMTGERERQLGGGDAGAVIDNGDAHGAGSVDGHSDAGGPRVD